MSRGTKFTKEQLRKLGFNPTPTGEWSKDRVLDDNPKSPAPKLERRPRSQKKGKSENQIKREEAIQRGIRYRLLITSYRTHLIDNSNPYLKVIEDQLTTHGVIPDDGPDFCDQPLFDQVKVMAGDERTTIEVLAYHVEGKAA